MKKAEAGSFRKVYASLTTDVKRLDQLTKVTRSEALERYRLPFFYGLITFEREFMGIDKYVESHLARVGRSAREILEYLALVTIYSNGGLPSALLKAMMGADPETRIALEDLVGAGPARLLIERASGVRFMHQIIAEQVLAHFRGGIADDWRLDLKPYAVDFIRDSVATAGPEALRGLFRQMFVDRIGGADGADDREDFAPIIEELDAIDITLGHSVLQVLADECPQEAHFWAHLGRHQVYRLRRDYEKAEEYLSRAISISPQDPLHHHTFGLVLRSRLRHALQALPRGVGLEQVFAGLDPLFGRAAAEFEETRRLSPENVYGYITHIQLIIMAARRLKDAAAADTIARVGATNPPIDTWLNENVADAEQLLREATHLYGTFDQSNEYLTECVADLDRLYGDLDSVVEIWELANASGRGGDRGRSALANAYLARNHRRWSGLDPGELRRMIDLMEQNLRGSARRDDDYQLWFNAFIMLPEFDANEALSNLALWSKRFPSWRAHYYAYVLNFMLWYTRRTEDLGPFERSLDECRRRHIGRRNSSSLWFGTSSSDAGLVPEDDLGGWKKDLGFFASPGALKPVNGMIERINGPQAGSIRIDGRAPVFFVPGREYSAHRSEEQPVHFFLGFSPTGLRAWSVESGRIAGADRAAAPFAQPGSVGQEVATPGARKSVKSARVKALRMERALRFCRELVMAKARIGATLTAAELGERLDAVMGTTGAAAQLGIADIAHALSESGEYKTWTDGQSIFIAPERSAAKLEVEHRARAEDRVAGQVVKYDKQKGFGFIQGPDGRDYWFHRDYVFPAYRTAITKAGAPVLFVPGEGGKGLIASGVALLENGVLTPAGPIPDDRVRTAATEFVLAELADAPPAGIPMNEFISRLSAAFASGGALEKKLGVKSVGAFFSQVDGVAVAGKPPHLMVRYSTELAFGRLAGGKVARQRQRGLVRQPETAPPALSVVKDRVLQIVVQAATHKKGLTLVQLRNRLHADFRGEREIELRLGYHTLPDLLREIEEIGWEGGDNGQVHLAAVPIEQLSLPTVQAEIHKLVGLAQASDAPLNSASLGAVLVIRYPGPKKVHDLLNFKTLRALVQSIPSIDIGPKPQEVLRIHPISQRDFRGPR